MIHHVEPIEVLHLFPVLDRELIGLLSSLNDEEWHRPTIAGKWTVKDVAAHLLDGNLRALSMLRDGFHDGRPQKLDDYRDLLTYLNSLNAEWVTAMKRLSPRVLIDLLASTGQEYYRYLGTLDPWGEAALSVAWAGEEISHNWFHMAREYTEKWIHQQHIRHAVDKPGIMTRELFYPFIDTFMCALPQTYKYVDAVTATSVCVIVTTDLGGEWHINKTEEGWVLRKETNVPPNATVHIDPDTAWKLFSKGISPEEALEQVKIEGDEVLGKTALGMVAVMA